eukprot:5440329-Heterocapsa_arctica.AAC.1
MFTPRTLVRQDNRMAAERRMMSHVSMLKQSSTRAKHLIAWMVVFIVITVKGFRETEESLDRRISSDGSMQCIRLLNE